MTVSFEGSKLTMILVVLSCIHVAKSVVKQCESVVGVCGRVSEPGITYEINLVCDFGYTCLALSQTHI